MARGQAVDTRGRNNQPSHKGYNRQAGSNDDRRCAGVNSPFLSIEIQSEFTVMTAPARRAAIRMDRLVPP